MQALLDDLQSDEQDELNKVSLERLAAIDPDLLVKIKSTAEESLRNGTGTENSGRAHTNSSKGPNKLTDELSFLVETRTPESIERSLTWENLNLQYMKDTHDIIASLNHILRESTSVDKRYTQKEAIEMTGALATAAATADLLTNTLERIKTMETNSKKKKSSTTLSGSQGLSGASRAAAPSFFAIDKTLFTNDGIKELNEAIVGLLYDIGLPFISSADGRRFATQLELSQHLDSLFKKSQLEKIIASTQERGWYENDSVWNGDSKSAEATGGGAIADDEGSSGPTVDDEANPDTFTVPADESRDRCVICGINFKMFFDNDDGIYKYSNSREIEVMNDEASAIASEQMLVHVTCWRNLGSPEFLTEDQTLRDQ
jgi:pre-mRNA cleavage complex 2 protein Pcf11